MAAQNEESKIKEILEKLLGGYQLDREEAFRLMHAIARGAISGHVVALVITVFRMRKPSTEELKGFREAFLTCAISVPLVAEDLLDLCGTGGDGKSTFNISTAAAFVVAGAGYAVAKHGNYSATSQSGSSNLMQAVGLKFTTSIEMLQRQLDEASICYLHAPLFHPALKNVSTVRRELGIRSVFNILGPILNPAQPNRQLIGVADITDLRLYYNLLREDHKDFVLVHTLDGYDELSLTDTAKILTNNGESEFIPEEFGFARNSAADLEIGNGSASPLGIFMDVIENRASPAQIETVVCNAGFGIRCMQPSLSLWQCFEMARESIKSGRAKRSLMRLLELC